MGQEVRLFTNVQTVVQRFPQPGKPGMEAGSGNLWEAWLVQSVQMLLRVLQGMQAAQKQRLRTFSSGHALLTPQSGAVAGGRGWWWCWLRAGRGASLQGQGWRLLFRCWFSVCLIASLKQLKGDYCLVLLYSRIKGLQNLLQMAQVVLSERRGRAGSLWHVLPPSLCPQAPRLWQSCCGPGCLRCHRSWAVAQEDPGCCFAKHRELQRCQTEINPYGL